MLTAELIKKVIRLMKSIFLNGRTFIKKFYKSHVNKAGDQTINKKFLGLITRCKDEYFVEEFCDYYLNEGVDQIIIIDDIFTELKFDESRHS